MNVTLSIDAELVAKARKIAEARGTSLNQLIRDHLTFLTSGGRETAALDELEQLWLEASGERETESWNRNDLYDRPVLR